MEDVGNAMLKSLEYDKDGALYAVFPDQPLIQWPDDESFRFFSVVLANKFIGSRQHHLRRKACSFRAAAAFKAL